MSLLGYWISNTLSDVIKAYIPMALFIFLARIFETNYDGVWILLLMFPPAIVGFSYVSTFAFSKNTNA